MRRLGRAVGAVALIAALLVGVPTLLVTIAGWPLPTSMPDWDNVYWSARQGDIPAEFVIKAFACVVWLAWAQIAWALLWELVVNVPRTVRGHTERSSPVTAAPASRLARRLVTAAMLLTAITSTPATTVAAPSLASFMTGGGPDGPTVAPATLIVDHDDTPQTSHTAETAAAVWVSGAGDTLWDVAERCLGDGSRVDEVLKCNPHLDPGRTLREGQRVTLPAGVTPPLDRTDGDTSDSAPVDSDAAAVTPGHAVTAVAGDTVWELTETHYGRVDVDLIGQVAAASGLADPSVLMPGDVVVFPELDTDTPPASPVVARPGWATHQVVRGDTLWDIVTGHYGTGEADTVWAVAAVNNLENPSLILPGQTIGLPPADELEHLAADPTATAEPPAEPPVAAPDPSPEADVPVPDGSVPAADTAMPDPDNATLDDTTSPIDPGVEAPPATPLPAPTPAPESVPPIPAASDTPTAPPVAVPAPATSLPSTSSRDAAVSRTVGDVDDVDERRVEADDRLSSRWLFGGAAATSLGLVGAWLTVRHLRRRRRRWLGLPEPQLKHHQSEPGDAERTAQLDVAMLADLVDADLRDQAIVRAVLLGERTEIRFRDTPPVAPAGWELTGNAWRQLADEPWSPAKVLSPALVTIGHGTNDRTREVVLDLLAAGTVSVTGDRVAVERLVCSMLWELAADPLDAPVDLIIVGLACSAAQHAANVGRQLTLDDAVDVATESPATAPQVFLVDPFADDTATGTLRQLTEACGPGSGRALVVAGPCEQPAEQISVPSPNRAMWDDVALTPPQLPEEIDVQLGRMLDSITVGRRDRSVSARAMTPDPEAEAVVLRSSLLVDAPDTDSDERDAYGGEDGDWFDTDNPAEVDGDAGDDETTPAAADQAPEDPPSTGEVVLPDVVLTVCGREIAIDGYEVRLAPPVLFVLAAAGRKMHINEVAELTGYSTKSLYNTFGGNHELVHRGDGQMWLADHVVTDYGWMRHCVSQLADAMRDDDQSPATRGWMLAAMEAIGRLEQAPYAVLPGRSPTTRSKRSSWEWVDEFPADTPARQLAETELAESALAFTELWLASTVNHDLVRRSDLLAELCRLAATVPYARVVRQLRDAQWESGASCLIVAAARVAGDDEALVARVQQCARELAGREALEASDELADELGL